MYSDLDNKKFDYLIVGTSLTESILASYLSKHQKKVLHLDINKYYGGDCKNFNFLEFEKHFKPTIENKKELYFTDAEFIDIFLNFPDGEKLRDYNIDINPKFLFAKSMATTELSDNKASNYLEFMSIKKSHVCYENTFICVPTSKSEIFLSTDLELDEKQKLLNFFLSIVKFKDQDEDMNATVDFKKSAEVNNSFLDYFKKNCDNLSLLDGEEFLSNNFSKRLYSIIKYVVGNFDLNETFEKKDCSNPNKKSVSEIINMIYKYLSSLDVYDTSPYLYPLYGSGEFSQALCRNASVFGATYIINNQLKILVKKNTVTNLSSNYFIKIFDEEKDEEFNVEVENLIINENFLNENCKSKFLFIGCDKKEEISINEILNINMINKTLKIQWFYILNQEKNEFVVIYITF